VIILWISYSDKFRGKNLMLLLIVIVKIVA